MAINDTEDTSRYDEMLAEVQALYDAGRDQEASERADKLLGKMERQGLNNSLPYSEAMRLFGMAQYRMKD